jgi:two-component system cell cycle response regulator DivK
VVDDLEDNRHLYATYFAYAGFRVAVAEDGEEALARVAKEKPDLIVMDLSMPRMDGWEATRLIKSNPRTKDIIVVVVTGHATTDDLHRARAAGADAICTKPCLPQDLLAEARTLLAKR